MREGTKQTLIAATLSGAWYDGEAKDDKEKSIRGRAHFHSKQSRDVTDLCEGKYYDPPPTLPVPHTFKVDHGQANDGKGIPDIYKIVRGDHIYDYKPMFIKPKDYITLNKKSLKNPKQQNSINFREKGFQLSNKDDSEIRALLERFVAKKALPDIIEWLNRSATQEEKNSFKRVFSSLSSLPPSSGASPQRGSSFMKSHGSPSSSLSLEQTPRSTSVHLQSPWLPMDYPVSARPVSANAEVFGALTNRSNASTTATADMGTELAEAVDRMLVILQIAFATHFDAYKTAFRIDGASSLMTRQDVKMVLIRLGLCSDGPVLDKMLSRVGLPRNSLARMSFDDLYRCITFHAYRGEQRHATIQEGEEYEDEQYPTLDNNDGGSGGGDGDGVCGAAGAAGAASAAGMSLPPATPLTRPSTSSTGDLRSSSPHRPSPSAFAAPSTPHRHHTSASPPPSSSHRLPPSVTAGTSHHHHSRRHTSTSPSSPSRSPSPHRRHHHHHHHSSSSSSSSQHPTTLAPPLVASHHHHHSNNNSSSSNNNSSGGGGGGGGASGAAASGGGAQAQAQSILFPSVKPSDTHNPFHGDRPLTTTTTTSSLSPSARPRPPPSASAGLSGSLSPPTIHTRGTPGGGARGRYQHPNRSTPSAEAALALLGEETPGDRMMWERNGSRGRSPPPPRGAGKVPLGRPIVGRLRLSPSPQQPQRGMSPTLSIGA